MDEVNPDFEASADFILNSSAGTTGTTGEQMIQFVQAPKIVHPENIQIKKIADSPR